MPRPVFVIDTSSLIALREWQPRRNHPKAWKQIDGLIDDNRLIAPEEVFREIQTGFDPLRKWASNLRKEKRLFKPAIARVVGIAKQLISNFRDLVDPDQPETNADPFVVALAIAEEKPSGKLAYDSHPEHFVVTEEKFTHSGRTRIPHVCEARRLQYLTIHQLFLRMRADEGWSW
jgi:Domain of unknown function (DUF4411)